MRLFNTLNQTLFWQLNWLFKFDNVFSDQIWIVEVYAICLKTSDRKYIGHFILVTLYVFTQPFSHRCNMRSIFNLISVCLNSVFSFSYIVCLTKTKEPSLPSYLLINSRFENVFSGKIPSITIAMFTELYDYETCDTIIIRGIYYRIQLFCFFHYCSDYRFNFITLLNIYYIFFLFISTSKMSVFIVSYFQKKKIQKISSYFCNVAPSTPSSTLIGVTLRKYKSTSLFL